MSNVTSYSENRSFNAPLYTLMQRLSVPRDTATSFLQDYMGSAEYEFGASVLPKTWLALAECDTILNFTVGFDRQNIKPVEVSVRYPVQIYKDFGKQTLHEVLTLIRAGQYRNKDVMIYEHDPQVTRGWLMINPLPMLFYRKSDKERAENWLENIRKLFKQAMAEDQETMLDKLRHIQRQATFSAFRSKMPVDNATWMEL